MDRRACRREGHRAVLPGDDRAGGGFASLASSIHRKVIQFRWLRPEVSYESFLCWAEKFGREFSNRIRHVLRFAATNGIWTSDICASRIGFGQVN
jgi:hypothetical protein